MQNTESAVLISGYVCLCSHAGLTKGITELLFRELSTLAIFQRGLFHSAFLCLYLCCHDILLLLLSGKKRDLIVVQTKRQNESPSLSHRPNRPFLLLNTFHLGHAHKGPFENITLPTFNSSLLIFICHHVRAVIHSVASRLPATFADFSSSQACRHTQVHCT